MKKGKLQIMLLSLFVIASMLLSACGADTATNTPAVTATAPPAPAPKPARREPPAPAPVTTDATATTGGGATSGNIIKIGVDLPTSGADASDGVPARNGAQLAI